MPGLLFYPTMILPAADNRLSPASGGYLRHAGTLIGFAHGTGRGADDRARWQARRSLPALRRAFLIYHQSWPQLFDAVPLNQKQAYLIVFSHEPA